MQIQKAIARAVSVDTLKQTVTQVKESQLPLAASSLAYTTILSVIPLLAVSFSIFHAFGGLDQLYKTIEPLIMDNLVEGTGEDAVLKIRQFVDNIHAGALGASGFVGLLITSMSLLSSIEKTVNKVWHTPIQRSLFHRIATYWLLITMGPLAFSLIIGYTSAGSMTEFTQMLPHGFLGFLAFFVIFTAMNRWIPNRHVHWIPAATAGFMTAVFWIIAKMVYTIYNQHVFTYNKIYGSLGAIPIFLVWIYLAWLVILTGSAYASVLQRRLDLK